MEVASLLSNIRILKQDPNALTREEIAQNISQFFQYDNFNENETALISEILHLLASDAEVAIRKILSEQLKSSKVLPHDVALQLANDFETSVSNPVLQESEVLTEADLTTIVSKTDEPHKLKAIASRKKVSEALSHALVEKEHEDVTHTLVKNNGADIADADYNHILNTFSNNGEILASMVKRSHVPIEIANRMVDLVSVSLKRELIEKHCVKKEEAEHIVTNAKEEMVISSLAQKNSPENIKKLVTQLHACGELTSSIILRSLCKGDIDFFEAAIAKLANIPTVNARQLIRSGDVEAFSKLYHKAHMPEPTFEAIKVILKIALKLQEKGKISEVEYKSKVLQHIVEGGYDQSIPVMPYIMSLMGNKN